MQNNSILKLKKVTKIISAEFRILNKITFQSKYLVLSHLGITFIFRILNRSKDEY
ncbi:hypothetical protein BC749_11321 [Flavobacterium araucananum]|nr:hypothetical protein BC749_11321 [Flavobacterium araucananum]